MTNLYFVLVLFWSAVNAFTNKSYEIHDLEYVSTKFSIEAAEWTAIGNLTAQLDTVCNKMPLLGGFGVLSSFGEFTRKYVSLPAHISLLLTLDLWVLDQRDKAPILIKVGNGSFWTSFHMVGNVTYVPSAWNGNVCGDPSLEDLMPVKVLAYFLHTGSTLFLKIRDPLTVATPKFFGIRNLKILLSQEPHSAYRCTISHPLSLLGQNGCSCSENQYYDNLNAQCKVCDSSCANCYNETSRHCFECNAGYFYNGSHCTPCDSSCQTCFGDSLNQCLTCKSGSFLTSNGNCYAPPPLTEKSTVDTVKEVGGTVASIGLMIVSAISAGSSGGLTAAVFAKMIEYIKYLNISYSDELEDALKSWQSGFIFLDFGPKMPDDFEKEFADQPLPYNFMKYELHSSFLVNFWESLSSLLIIFAGLVVCFIVQAVTKRPKKQSAFHKIVNRTRVIIQNFLLTLLYNSFSDIIFFSVLEFRSAVLDSFKAILSFLVSLLLVFIVFGLLFFHIRLLRKLQERRKTQRLDLSKIPDQNNSNTSAEEQFKGLEIFFKDFKDNSFSQQAFLCFFAIRDIIFATILTTLFEHPLVEALLLLLLNIVMLVFLFVKAPFKEMSDLVQQIFNEVVILVVNSSVLTMASMEDMKMQSSGTVEGLSKLIIVTSLIFSFAMNVFLIVRFVIGIKNLYQARKMKKIKNLSLKTTQIELTNKVTINQNYCVELSNDKLKALPISKLDVKNPKVTTKAHSCRFLSSRDSKSFNIEPNSVHSENSQLPIEHSILNNVEAGSFKSKKNQPIDVKNQDNLRSSGFDIASDNINSLFEKSFECSQFSTIYNSRRRKIKRIVNFSETPNKTIKKPDIGFSDQLNVSSLFLIQDHDNSFS